MTDIARTVRAGCIVIGLVASLAGIVAALLLVRPETIMTESGPAIVYGRWLLGDLASSLPVSPVRVMGTAGVVACLAHLVLIGLERDGEDVAAIRRRIRESLAFLATLIGLVLVLTGAGGIALTLEAAREAGTRGFSSSGYDLGAALIVAGFVALAVSFLPLLPLRKGRQTGVMHA